MAKKRDALEALEWKRWWGLAIYFFAWRPFPDFMFALDRRRRTTDLQRRLTKYARGLVLGNALLLARAYLAWFLRANDWVLSDWWFDFAFPVMSGYALLWAYLQALLAAKGVSMIYDKAVAVNGGRFPL